MKNNQINPPRNSPRRTKKQDTLIQTRVPTTNAKALRLTAQASGSTLAGYVRKMIIDATTGPESIQIPEDIYTTDVNFAFSDERDDEIREIKVGEKKTFIARMPFTFRLDAIEFEGDYIIQQLFVGNRSVFPVFPTPEIPTTDYPGRRLDISQKICAGMNISIDVSATENCLFKARLIGKRSEKSSNVIEKRPKLKPAFMKKASVVAINVGNESIPPGAIREFRARTVVAFQCDRIVVDDHESFTLQAVEICREPQIDGQKKLDHSTPLQLNYAHPGEEIRIFIQNVSKKETLFKARLHGLAIG